MELPTHPEADDPATSGPSPSSSSPSPSRWSRVLVGLLLGLVAVVVLLHLTGVVGPAGN